MLGTGNTKINSHLLLVPTAQIYRKIRTNKQITTMYARRL